MDYWGDPGDSDNAPAYEHAGDQRAVADVAYGPGFAGYPGSETEVHEGPLPWGESEGGGWSDGWWDAADPGVDPDWAVGGQPATPTSLPYSIGPVDPSYVEQNTLTGRILMPGRDPETGAGPVGATQYRGDLIMQIVQQMGPEYTGTMAAIGLLSGV